MTERPIIFNDSMSLAIIEGRKTVTRRPFPLKHQAHSGGVAYDQWSGIAELVADGPSKRFKVPCVVGDKLWVREAWSLPPSALTIYYRAGDGARLLSSRDASDNTESVNAWVKKLSRVAGPSVWAPSIHMPRWASRTTLDVLTVRVERLQSMTEADAHAEGFDPIPAHCQWVIKCRSEGGHWSARPAFAATWDAIYPAMPWSSNPWVWVVQFKREGVV